MRAGVALAAGGTQLWLTNRASNTVTVYATDSKRKLAQIGLEGFPIRAEADEARKRAGQMPPGCDCAQVVLGKLYPDECRLYGSACNPRHPIGPCMVSDEGACRIWWAGGVRESRRKDSDQASIASRV